MILSGEHDCGRIIAAIKRTINSIPEIKIDYIEIVAPQTLESINKIRGPAVVLLAVFVGHTRLIDNIKV